MKLFKVCVQTLSIYAGLERPRKDLTLQTLETRMSEPSTPTCWNSLRTVLELCGVTVGFSEFRHSLSFFFPWCFESVPFSNRVAKCSSPWRLLCALHVRNGWISHSFGELHIKDQWLSFCWRWLFSCLAVSSSLISHLQYYRTSLPVKQLQLLLSYMQNTSVLQNVFAALSCVTYLS